MGLFTYGSIHLSQIRLYILSAEDQNVVPSPFNGFRVMEWIKYWLLLSSELLHWNSRDKNSIKVSQILFSYISDRNSTVDWRDSQLPLYSVPRLVFFFGFFWNYSKCFVYVRYHSHLHISQFFSSLEISRYLCKFSLPFNFTMWGTAKLTS